MKQYDYVIVGSGIAGLFAALLAKDHGSVLILTKGSIDECNTKYAQGGIAAPVGPDDSPELHLRDTIAAGAGLVDEEAARILTGEATERIADLVRFGVPFDSVEGHVALGREGAHSRARVLHAGGDSTGEKIELSLSSLARMSAVTVREYCLVERDPDGGRRRVRGVEALDARSGGRERFDARFVILATGGAGQLYQVTTNPDVATADGVALAYRAGAEIADMEFIQFHPTALRLPGVPDVPHLRGGARRRRRAAQRRTGSAFMSEHHPQKDLAPRDVVARAIVAEMARTGSDHVVSRRDAPAAGEGKRPLPADLSLLPRPRPRHHPSADPRLAGGALHDGRRPHEHLGRDEPARAVRLRRGGLHGRARREPAGEQLAAGDGRLCAAGRRKDGERRRAGAAVAS